MKTILVVEDAYGNRTFMQRVLTALDYRYLEAETGIDGIVIAANEMPDVILLDVNLPDIDGYEVLTRLKQNPKTAYIPVIVLTANALKRDREKALAAGADGYLPKPLGVNDIINFFNNFFSDTKWQ